MSKIDIEVAYATNVLIYYAEQNNLDPTCFDLTAIEKEWEKIKASKSKKDAE